MADQSVDAAASTSNKQKFTSEQLAVRNQRAKKWYADNKERRREYWAANAEKIAEQRRKSRAANRDKVNEQARKWREANKEQVNARRRQNRVPNRDKINEQARKYRASNKDKIQAYHRQYDADRRREDPSFKLCDLLRARLRSALQKKFKAGSAVSDLGCTGEQACEHLESLFDEHMTWDNWGTYWQVDHIYPLNKANLEDRIEFLAVNNWRNLQPLKKGENIRKGDTVTPEAQKLFDDLKTQFLKEEV